MRNRALWEKFKLYFWKFFASIDKIYITKGGQSTSLLIL